MASRSFEDQWPKWPDSVKGKTLISVLVSTDLSNLCRGLFGSRSAFVIQSHGFRGNSGYGETPWLGTEAELELEACQLLDSSPQPWKLDAAGPCPTRGQLRKVGFSSVGMGMKYTTEEVQRVVEAKPGELYVVEAVVCTTATYGDCFRPITRFRLSAKGSKTVMTVEYTLAFIAPVNRIIRGFIERGAEQGLSKNFGQVIEVLRQQMIVEDADSARLAGSAAVQQGVPSAMGGVPHGAGPVLQWGGLLDSELVTLMETPAALLRRWLPFGAGGGTAWVEGQPSRSAQVLALLLTLLTLSWALAALESLQTAIHQSTRLGAATAAAFLDSLQLATSLRTLLSSFILLAIVRQVVTHVTAIVPALLEALLERRRQLSARAATTASEAGGRRQSSTSEDAPSTGVKFEGYEEAIASATGSSADWKGSAEVALQNTMSAFRGMLSPRSLSAPAHAAATTEAAGSDSTVLSPRSVSSFLGLLGSRPRLEESSTEGDTEQAAPLSAADVARCRLPDPELEPSGALVGSPAYEHHMELHRSLRASTASVCDAVYVGRPGHFLPTDRVGHWSARDGAPGGKLSMSFRNVAPKLPPGFTWLEEKWHVDLSGQSADAVDADGWTYAVDFPWLKMPPIPGAGRMTVKDFVRRRRWIRTRVPITSEGTPEQRGAAEPSEEAPAGEPGLVEGQSPTRLHEALSYPRTGALSDAEVEKAVRDISSSPPAAVCEDPSPQLLPAAQGTAAGVGQAEAPAAPPAGVPRGCAEGKPQQGQLPQPEAIPKALNVVLSDVAAGRIEAADQSDGESSPRYTAHPATVQPQTLPVPSSSSSSSAPLSPSKLKLNMPSWMHKAEPLAAATAHSTVPEGSLVRTTSNASSEEVRGGTSSRDWSTGSVSEARAQAHSLPHPSPLGPPMGRLTVEQAATAARLLMAGYSMDTSVEYAVSPRGSPKAHVADSGHMLFGSAAVASTEASHSPPNPGGSERGLPDSEPEQGSSVPDLSRTPETTGDVPHSTWTADSAPEPAPEPAGAAQVEHRSPEAASTEEKSAAKMDELLTTLDP